MTNYVIAVYSIYLVFIAAATIYVGKTLFSHSKVFMETIFNGRSHLANATNKLFEMGFFLLAFGIGFYLLKEDVDVYTERHLFELTSTKAGGYTLFLGVLMLLNLFLFFKGMKYRRKTDLNKEN